MLASTNRIHRRVSHSFLRRRAVQVLDHTTQEPLHRIGNGRTCLRRRLQSTSTGYNNRNSNSISLLHQRKRRWQPQFASLSLTPYRRHLSDRTNLLGHSPMASGTGASTRYGDDSTHIPTAQEAVVGGVWQATSAKRDKLGELKVEAASSESLSHVIPALDSMATSRQARDLALIDGVTLIVQRAERPRVAATSALTTSITSTETLIGQDPINSALSSLEAATASRPSDLHQVQWDELLQDYEDTLQNALIASTRPESLATVREWYDASGELLGINDSEVVPSVKDASSDIKTTAVDPAFQLWLQEHIRLAQSDTGSSTVLQHDFDMAELRVRLQMALAIVQYLAESSSWKVWTAVTDQDVDRAAVRQQQEQSPPGNLVPGACDTHATLSAAKVHSVVTAFLTGGDQVAALWNLMDKDDDGLLDEAEVVRVVEATLQPVQKALTQVWTDALEASPMAMEAALPDGTTVQPKKLGWRQRRREAKDRKRMTKLWSKCLTRHFDDEIELPHRVRCSYSWANKAHQDNKIDSVLVQDDSSSGGVSGVTASVLGRKRYVELLPKCSLDEFREVQRVHFPQLDGVGAEYVRAFREDLWVEQGKGRQNKELVRDCTLFLVSVSLVDYIILAL